MRTPPFAILVALSACSGGEAEQRVDLDQKPEFASQPMDSPSTEGAFWSESAGPNIRSFGITGLPPLFTVACEKGQILLTRHAPADPQASALMPLIGSGRIERLPVEAVSVDGGHIWQGRFDASDERLNVFNGSRNVEVTIPGAGTIDLAPDVGVAALIAACSTERAKEAPQPAE